MFSKDLRPPPPCFNPQYPLLHVIGYIDHSNNHRALMIMVVIRTMMMASDGADEHMFRSRLRLWRAASPDSKGQELGLVPILCGVFEQAGAHLFGARFH